MNILFLSLTTLKKSKRSRIRCVWAAFRLWDVYTFPQQRNISCTVECVNTDFTARNSSLLDSCTEVRVASNLQSSAFYHPASDFTPTELSNLKLRTSPVNSGHGSYLHRCSARRDRNLPHALHATSSGPSSSSSPFRSSSIGCMFVSWCWHTTTKSPEGKHEFMGSPPQPAIKFQLRVSTVFYDGW